MTGGSLRVLTYHRVLHASEGAHCNPSVVSATPATFERQVRHLAKRFCVLSADEVIGAIRDTRSLPRRAVLITFDDACRDFGEIAWPILRKYRLAATLFVPTAYPDHPERQFWWHRLHRAIATTACSELQGTPFGVLRLDTPTARRASLRLVQQSLKAMPHREAMSLVDRLCHDLGAASEPRAEVLEWSELRALASDGVTMGAHTRTHPALTQLSPEDARQEICRSRDDLTRELGAAPALFAYPFGDLDDRVVGLVREAGFAMAVTCLDGSNSFPFDDPFRLRRTNITRRTSPLVFRLRLTAPGAYLDRWRHRATRDSERAGGASAAPGNSRSGSRPPLRVAYIMSRFPKLSETFVLNEMRAVASLGVPVEVYPLRRERQRVVHPEVEEWVRRAHFRRLFSPAMVRAHAHFVLRQPHTYVRLWLQVATETWGGRRKAFFGALGAFPRAVQFAYEMRRLGVSHVHAHFANHPAVAAYVINQLTGIPFSFTAHGSDLHVDQRMLETKVEAAAFAVTVSEFNKQVMVQACADDAAAKVHVIHCGVDPDYFAPPAATRPRVPFRIVCVASLEEVKGHRYLVEACRILRERGVDFCCDLVGEGPLRLAIEAQIGRCALGESVRLLGGRPRPEVVRLLAGANVAVLASHPTRQGKREGVPVALMEAMACETPVVATAISGIPELVEANVSGLLVPSGDPVALADALERLSRDGDLCDRLGRAGRERVLREYSLRTSSERLVALFRALRARTALAAAPHMPVVADGGA